MKAKVLANEKEQKHRNGEANTGDKTHVITNKE